MWKYAALVSYVGTDYCGWQKQRGSASQGKPSIQETMERVLERITGEAVTIVGSGRTDSGVHAVGQVAHFVLKKKEWDVAVLCNGMNALLPRSIQLQEVRRVPIDFHAQRSASRKQYSYYFQQGPCALPHLEPYTWWIRKRLDLETMSEAVNALVGKHDFKPFQSSGAKPGPTVREVLEAQVSLEPLPFPLLSHETMRLVRVRLLGTGFLKQMVRGIAGTLLQVGEGRRDPSCIHEILESLRREEVGPTAPARALWLERVWYDCLGKNAFLG